MAAGSDWSSTWLGENGHGEIEKAIVRAEAKTSGEIVPVLVRRSSTVGHVPMIGTLVCLIAVFLFDLPFLMTRWGGSELLWMGLCSLVAVALGYGLARFDVVNRLLTPRSDQARQVNLRAQVEFYELGLNKTEGRTGILLMVSVMEHRAVVLADEGISAHLDDSAWQEVVDLMIEGVKGGDLAHGMTKAIARCGERLQEYCPISDDDVNELSDRVVVKD